MLIKLSTLRNAIFTVPKDVKQFLVRVKKGSNVKLYSTANSNSKVIELGSETVLHVSVGDVLVEKLLAKHTPESISSVYDLLDTRYVLVTENGFKEIHALEEGLALVKLDRSMYLIADAFLNAQFKDIPPSTIPDAPTFFIKFHDNSEQNSTLFSIASMVLHVRIMKETNEFSPVEGIIIKRNESGNPEVWIDLDLIKISNKIKSLVK